MTVFWASESVEDRIAPEGLSLIAESLRALVQATDPPLVAIDGGTLVVNGFDVRRDAYYDPTTFPQPAGRG